MGPWQHAKQASSNDPFPVPHIPSDEILIWEGEGGDCRSSIFSLFFFFPDLITRVYVCRNPGAPFRWRSQAWRVDCLALFWDGDICQSLLDRALRLLNITSLTARKKEKENERNERHKKGLRKPCLGNFGNRLLFAFRKVFHGEGSAGGSRWSLGTGRNFFLFFQLLAPRYSDACNQPLFSFFFFLFCLTFFAWLFFSLSF